MMFVRSAAGFGMVGFVSALLTSGVFAQDNPVVVVETGMGSITIELSPQEAPLSVENFLAYVDAEHYDNTIFHRIMQNFMIQGGGFSPEMSRNQTRAPIKNEAENGLTNDRYTIAMARTNEIDSATDQFFINIVDNNFLNNGVRDFGYAVFGRVIDGTEVVDRIAATPVTNSLPNETVMIRSIRRQ